MNGDILSDCLCLFYFHIGQCRVQPVQLVCQFQPDFATQNWPFAINLETWELDDLRTWQLGNLTIRELKEDLAPDRRYWIPQDRRGNGIVGHFARGLLCPVVPVVTFQKHPAREKLLRDCCNCPNPRIDRDRETLHEYKVLTCLFVSRLVSTKRSFFSQ